MITPTRIKEKLFNHIENVIGVIGALCEPALRIFLILPAIGVETIAYPLRNFYAYKPISAVLSKKNAQSLGEDLSAYLGFKGIKNSLHNLAIKTKILLGYNINHYFGISPGSALKETCRSYKNTLYYMESSLKMFISKQEKIFSSFETRLNKDTQRILYTEAEKIIENMEIYYEAVLKIYALIRKYLADPSQVVTQRTTNGNGQIDIINHQDLFEKLRINTCSFEKELKTAESWIESVKKQLETTIPLQEHERLEIYKGTMFNKFRSRTSSIPLSSSDMNNGVSFTPLFTHSTTSSRRSSLIEKIYFVYNPGNNLFFELASSSPQEAFNNSGIKSFGDYEFGRDISADGDTPDNPYGIFQDEKGRMSVIAPRNFIQATKDMILNAHYLFNGEEVVISASSTEGLHKNHFDFGDTPNKINKLIWYHPKNEDDFYGKHGFVHKLNSNSQELLPAMKIEEWKQINLRYNMKASLS